MLIRNLLCTLPIFVALLMLHKPKQILKSVGLQGGILQGLFYSLLFTLPMFVGFACVNSFNHSLTLNDFIRYAVLSGFFEELFFRGFLFGQLYRVARWGFVPASLAGALVFGAAHLYQGNDVISALSAFSITALGAVLFSWVYAEWRCNLWIAIGLHIFMNASWMLFSVSNGAVGDVMSNVFRGICIVFVVAITILYKRKHHIGYAINRKTLWINRNVPDNPKISVR
jgi:membrane protease YdiL (CAAX protease family)